MTLHSFILLLSFSAFCLTQLGCSEKPSTVDDLFAGLDDSRIRGLNTADTTLFPPPETIHSNLIVNDIAHALYTPDSKHIIVAHASELFGREVATMYDLSTGNKVRTFKPYPSAIQRFSSMAISHNGKYLAVAGKIHCRHFRVPSISGLYDMGD